MQAEGRLLKPLRPRVYVGGGTARGAQHAAARAVSAGADALISFGLAGGLRPGLAAGALVIPGAVLARGRHLAVDPALAEALGGVNAATLLAGDAVVASVGGKAERWAGTGADAVDLESGAVAEAAQRAQIPFAVLRAVCDPAERPLPSAAHAALDGAGGIGFLRVLGALLADPGQIGGLLALSREAARARRALAERVATLAEGRGLVRWTAVRAGL